MPTFGMLSTYPPAQCGVATFSAALLKHLTPQGYGSRDGAPGIRRLSPPASSGPFTPHAPGLGRPTPIVATRFPHAVELLADGAGLLVPHGDVAATTAALHSVLTRPGAAASMTAASGRIAPALEWPAVADSYRTPADSLLSARAEAVA